MRVLSLIPPMALLMVDGGKSFYQGATEQFLIRDLLPQVGHWGLSTRPQQRALLGVSMGGFGAFVLQLLAEKGALDGGLKIRTLTLPDVFQDQDSPFAMYQQAGLNALHQMKHRQQSKDLR